MAKAFRRQGNGTLPEALAALFLKQDPALVKSYWSNLGGSTSEKIKVGVLVVLLFMLTVVSFNAFLPSSQQLDPAELQEFSQGVTLPDLHLLTNIRGSLEPGKANKMKKEKVVYTFDFTPPAKGMFGFHITDAKRTPYFSFGPEERLDPIPEGKTVRLTNGTQREVFFNVQEVKPYIVRVIFFSNEDGYFMIKGKKR